jgi:hypothetical protein
MLTQPEIERMLLEMGVSGEADRTRYIEWSKVTLRPDSPVQAFIRIAATTKAEGPDGGRCGELERDS